MPVQPTRKETNDHPGQSGDMKLIPDATLAKMITATSPRAEAELCRRFRPRTLAFLKGQTRSDAQAEDIAQETLLVVLMTLREGKLSDPEKLACYVRQTARNLLILDLRKHRRRASLLKVNSATTDNVEEDKGMTVVARREARNSIQRALTRLTVERDREILIQHYLMEMGWPSICNNMEIDRDQFDRIISRARQRARKYFGAEQQELLAC